MVSRERCLSRSFFRRQQHVSKPWRRLKQSSEMLSPRRPGTRITSAAGQNRTNREVGAGSPCLEQRHLVTDATIVSEGHKLPWLCCRMLLIQLLHLVKLLLLMLLVIDRVSGEEDYDYDDKMMLMMMTMTLMMMTMTRIRV